MRATTTWTNNGGGTNSSGFSALAAGDFSKANGKFENLGLYAYFWTSTIIDIYGHGGHFYILNAQEPVPWGVGDTTTAFSCRCIKDP